MAEDKATSIDAYIHRHRECGPACFITGDECPPPPDYSEHEKLRPIADKSQAIGEFMDWLSDQGYILTEHKCPHGYWPMEECEESEFCYRGENNVQLWPSRRRIQDLLAEFFGIDQKKLEAEKRAMLAALRDAG